MSERCHICGATMADHRCPACGNNTCSSCADENGLCRKCKSAGRETSFRIGIAPLRAMANMPMFIASIAIIIIGMVVIFSASPAPADQEPGGFIYIFPFPFVFAWGSPDMVIAVLLIIAAVAIPIALLILVFRKMSRV